MEDTASYRRRAEEAEREVERLRARQQNVPLGKEGQSLGSDRNPKNPA